MSEQKRRKHTPETIARIREKRMARVGVNDPRHAGQSKKRKSLYEELMEDYKKYPEAKQWLKEHQEELGFLPGGKKKEIAEEMIRIAKDWGIETEYTDMYRTQYEIRVGSMLFSGDDVTNFNIEEDKLITEIDYDDNL